MNNEHNDQWLRANLLGIISIVITVMTFAYFGVIKGNENSNRIKAHDEMMTEMKLQIKMLEDKKVDKEVFMMLQTTLAGMAIDIKEIRTTQFSEKLR